MYGKMPGKPEKMSYEINSIDKGALKGKATRKEISVVMKNKRTEVRMDILIYLPNFQPKPVANFIALNFYGNHSIHQDSNHTPPNEAANTAAYCHALPKEQNGLGYAIVD